MRESLQLEPGKVPSIGQRFPTPRQCSRGVAVCDPLCAHQKWGALNRHPLWFDEKRRTALCEICVTNPRNWRRKTSAVNRRNPSIGKPAPQPSEIRTLGQSDEIRRVGQPGQPAFQKQPARPQGCDLKSTPCPPDFRVSNAIVPPGTCPDLKSDQA
jgi:hypothetical protein